MSAPDTVGAAREARSPGARRWGVAGWVVAGVAGVLAVGGPFLPDLMLGRDAANRAADQVNLQQIHSWLLRQRDARAGLPTVGGHRLLLQLWGRVCEPTPENLAHFFEPGRDDDPHRRE